MKKPCIRRGKIVKVHDGSLLHYVTLESGGRRRRFFCGSLRWAVLNPQLSADVWLCHRGRRLIDMVPARGDRPSPMDRLLLLSSLANALQLPDTIDRAPVSVRARSSRSTSFLSAPKASASANGSGEPSSSMKILA